MTTHAYKYNLIPSAIDRRPSTITVEGINHATPKLGYIAGAADGIITVQSKPAKREILLMDANSHDYQFVGRVWSLDSGHYMFNNLDPDKEYLIMARDYNKEFEPFSYDYVAPATDITPSEQRALRETWKK